MSNILEERVRAARLTRTQQKIADYFLENQSRIAVMSSIEVAREIGVSDASIIRFSRMIGFDGFSDLKAQLYEGILRNSFAGLSLSQRLEQSETAYPQQDREELFTALMVSNAERSLRANAREKLDRVADLITNAAQRYVIGLRGARGTAMNFGRLLAFMLPNVHMLVEEGCLSISTLQDATAQSVVVMFVLSRYYKVDVDFLRLAKSRGAQVVLVTNEEDCCLREYADVILKIFSDNMLFFHSITGMESVAEYILTLVGQRAEYRERIDERDQMTAEQRIPELSGSFDG